MAPALVRSLAGQALRTLALLHRQGVVHRGLTLEGLRLGEDGVLRLADLGRAVSGREPAATRALAPHDPAHLDPALWPAGGAAAEGGDAGSDLYALGVVLHQLLSGRVRDARVPQGSARGRAPSRDCPQVPIWLDKVVLRALAPERAQRFASAEDMLQALESGAAWRPAGPASPAAACRRRCRCLRAGRWRYGPGRC
jgi:serine/threonine protein kinase